MNSRTHRRLVSILVLGTIVILGLREDAERITISGLEYVAFGGASLEIHDGIIAVTGLDTKYAAVLIHVADAPQGDIFFDPVPIPKGSSFSASALDQDGKLLAEFELVQTGDRSTEVWLNLGQTAGRLESDTIEVFARSDTGDELRIEVPANHRIFLGTVTAPTTAWAKTYHWFCSHGECHLIIDPDETEITFANDPSVSVPFRYLGVVLKFRDAVDTRVAVVELGNIK